MTGRTLRVATWNVQGAFKGARPAPWEFLTERGVEVALAQESYPAPLPWTIVAPARPFTNKGWGTAVAARNLDIAPLPAFPANKFRKRTTKVTPPEPTGADPGTMQAATITLPDTEIGSVVVVSLYARINDGYSFMNIHGMLNTLTPLIDGPLGRHVLIGGDINNGTQLPVTDPRWPQHRNLMDRFTATGFVDLLDRHLPLDRGPLKGCACGPMTTCRHVRTQRHGNKTDSKPWQTDYLWATPALTQRVTSCRTLDEEPAWAISDHCPVVADIDLG